jgi:hypothetical protein
MAELIPGFIAGTIPANVHRMIHAASFMRSGAAGISGQVGARSGILGYKSLRVTASTGLTLAVASGPVLLQGSGATQGAYVLINNADDSVVLATANSTLARKDAVIARVYDTTDGVGGNGNQWFIDKVTGNPAASPVLPAIPVDSILLAEVNVPAAASTITSGNIIDRRVFTVAMGGVLPTVTTALPTDPAPGQMVWLDDINALDVWDGSAYQRIYRPRLWTDFTMNAPYANLGEGYANFGWSVLNGMVSLRGVIRSTGPNAAQAVIATLPVGARPSYQIAMSIIGPGGNTLVRVDILTNGTIRDTVAHGLYGSMLMDTINFPLG